MKANQMRGARVPSKRACAPLTAKAEQMSAHMDSGYSGNDLIYRNLQRANDSAFDTHFVLIGARI